MNFIFMKTGKTVKLISDQYKTIELCCLTVFPEKSSSTALPVLPPTNIVSEDNAKLVHQYLMI